MTSDFRCECGGWADTGNAGFCNYCVEKFGPPMPTPSERGMPERVWLTRVAGMIRVDEVETFTYAGKQAEYLRADTAATHDAIERAVREAYVEEAYMGPHEDDFVASVMRRLDRLADQREPGDDKKGGDT